MHESIRRLAKHTSDMVGNSYAFLTATIVIMVWAAIGPWFRYSDTWQLVINTGTTIVTFLMMFLLQSTQNRDSRAIQLKLDELIRATTAANSHLIKVEHAPEKVVERVEQAMIEECPRQPEESA
jgi:low affinity Fe/Cu permease